MKVKLTEEQKELVLEWHDLTMLRRIGKGYLQIDEAKLKALAQKLGLNDE